MSTLKRTLLLVAFLAVGCGGPSLQEPAESTQARQALCAALDAWQRGEQLDSLRAASPAVHVKDPDWPAGFRLMNYQVAADGDRLGIDLRYRVALTLKDPRGRTIRRNTTYMVGTSPVCTVVRHDPES
jgi:hypothetical protein